MNTKMILHEIIRSARHLETHIMDINKPVLDVTISNLTVMHDFNIINLHIIESCFKNLYIIQNNEYLEPNNDNIDFLIIKALTESNIKLLTMIRDYHFKNNI